MRRTLIMLFLLLVTPVGIHAQEIVIPVEIAASSMCKRGTSQRDIALLETAEQMVRSHLAKNAAFLILPASASSSRNRIRLALMGKVDDLRVLELRRISVFVQFVPANETWGYGWWIIEGGGYGSSTSLSQQSTLENFQENLDRLMGDDGTAFLKLVFAKWKQPNHASLSKSIAESSALFKEQRRAGADCEIYEGRGY